MCSVSILRLLINTVSVVVSAGILTEISSALLVGPSFHIITPARNDMKTDESVVWNSWREGVQVS